MKTTRWLICSLLLLIGLSAQAAELTHGIEIHEDNSRYTDDYIFLGRELTFNGEAEDLYFLGSKLNSSGTINQGVIGFGEKLALAGQINNGVISGGRSITLSGPIKGTVFLAGEDLILEETSTVEGSVFAVSRMLNLQGPIEGDLRSAAADVLISNVINGDVILRVGKLSISDEGRINGNLEYFADYEISDEEAARVSGTITYSKHKEKDEFAFLREKKSETNHWWIRAFLLVSFIISGLLILLFPIFRALNDRIPNREFWYSSLWGLIPIFVYPTAILILAILVITIPFSIALALAGVPLVLLTLVIGATMVGRQLVSWTRFTITSRFLYFLIGGILYSIVALIPFLNLVSTIFVSALGCGVLIWGIFRRKLA